MNMKNNSVKQAMLSLLLGFIVLLSARICQAATHYVSPTGSASWSSSTNINTPTDVQTAFNNAIAGDIVYFRGGTYNVPAKTDGNSYSGYYMPAHSGTSGNPIIFQAYPSEVPVFNGTATGGEIWGTNGAIGETIFGVTLQFYIVFDGFTFQSDNGTTMARMFIGSNGEYSPPHTTGYVTVQNCTFNGGSNVHTGSDNCEGVRVDSSSYVTIQNNRIYNYRESTNNHNTSAFKEYNNDHTVIKNNEIYNNTNGVYYKRDCEQCTISYNYIHDNYLGSLVAIYSNSSSAVFSAPNLQVYQNVFANNSYYHLSGDNDQSNGATADNWQIYNNTFYNSGDTAVTIDGSTSSSNGATIFNNIFMLPGSGYGDWLGEGTAHYLAFDHNQWGNGTIKIIPVAYSPVYTSLSAWQASTTLAASIDVGCGSSTHPGCGDLASNPLFTNGSGNYSLLSDFKLQAGSPCKGSGRAGVDMGANIALVGLGGNGKIPSPPSNLR